MLAIKRRLNGRKRTMGERSAPARNTISFGPFELSTGKRILKRDGLVLSLGGRALDTLIYLVSRPGEVITKNEFLEHVWPDVTVEEGSLRVHIAAIRKALGDGRFGDRYIANIKGRGYSFVSPVVAIDDHNGSPQRDRRSRLACPE
jgi:DNA-binding winged helix-turn-helix (wHTH) protein